MHWVGQKYNLENLFKCIAEPTGHSASIYDEQSCSMVQIDKFLPVRLNVRTPFDWGQAIQGANHSWWDPVSSWLSGTPLR